MHFLVSLPGAVFFIERHSKVPICNLSLYAISASMNGSWKKKFSGCVMKPFGLTIWRLVTRGEHPPTCQTALQQIFDISCNFLLLLLANQTVGFISMSKNIRERATNLKKLHSSPLKMCVGRCHDEKAHEKFLHLFGGVWPTYPPRIFMIQIKL